MAGFSRLGNGVCAQDRGELLEKTIAPKLPISFTGHAHLLVAAPDGTDELGRLAWPAVT